MNLSQSISDFISLGNSLRKFLNQPTTHHHEEFMGLEHAVQNSFAYNGWFTPKEVRRALEGISYMLAPEKLNQWIQGYELPAVKPHQTVAVVGAGNIPAVAFHDVLCVLVSGHKLQLKLSSEDQLLIPAMLQLLPEWENHWKYRVLVTQKLEKFDAVIATGSNNTARYFKNYFSKYPHIIRKNRTSVAVLDGNESEEELRKLGFDIFSFYGLGCRNVSKVYLPAGFNLDRLFSAFLEQSWVMENNKYMNNYQYNKTLYLLNNESVLDNEFIILKASEQLHSPLGVLFYEEYDSIDKVKTDFSKRQEEIQCIVGKEFIEFGKAQKPELWDYADGLDTLQFLTCEMY